MGEKDRKRKANLNKYVLIKTKFKRLIIFLINNNILLNLVRIHAAMMVEFKSHTKKWRISNN